MKRVLILACVVIGWHPAGAARATAEPLVLDVWPGKAVGDHGQIGPVRMRAAAEAPTKDARWITNVTRPTISVFRPDAANNARVAVVICPGGGYWNLAWDKEGEEVAAWLNTLGITGVVLKYRVPRRPGEPKPLPAPGPLLDAQRASPPGAQPGRRLGNRPGADRDHGVLGRRASGGDDGDLVRETVVRADRRGGSRELPAELRGGRLSGLHPDTAGVGRAGRLYPDSEGDRADVPGSCERR